MKKRVISIIGHVIVAILISYGLTIFEIKSKIIWGLLFVALTYLICAMTNKFLKPNTILYAGRLVSVKGVEKLIKSLIILQKNNIEYKLLIAGSGPDELELKKIVDEYHLNVVFLGRITQENLAHYYSLSEIFVSLNPSEPFGIVFPEALLSQCKIVCPYTGGQVEYLSDYSKSVAFVDETDENSISNGIKNMLMNGEQPILNDEQMKSFTYKEITRKIINCYKLRKK